jgi:hypothetical protein
MKYHRTIALQALIAIVFALVVAFAITATSGCSSDWNRPLPVLKEEGNPCWLDWHSCGNGKCCHDSHDCRPNGGCAWGGLDNPTSWGAGRDGGASQYPQQTPEQIRRSQGAPL